MEGRQCPLQAAVQGIRLGSHAAKWGFPKIRGTILGVPITRTIVFWDQNWGPQILGNYQMAQGLRPEPRPQPAVVAGGIPLGRVPVPTLRI